MGEIFRAVFFFTEEREFPPCHPWGDLTNPFLFLVHWSETGSGWLEVGCDAGEYCGETGEDCEAGVPSTCEP